MRCHLQAVMCEREVCRVHYVLDQEIVGVRKVAGDEVGYSADLRGKQRGLGLHTDLGRK